MVGPREFYTTWHIAGIHDQFLINSRRFSSLIQLLHHLPPRMGETGDELYGVMGASKSLSNVRSESSKKLLTAEIPFHPSYLRHLKEQIVETRHRLLITIMHECVMQSFQSCQGLPIHALRTNNYLYTPFI